MKIALISVALPYRGGISKHTSILVEELSKKHAVDLINYSRQYPDFLFPGKSQYIEKEVEKIVEVPIETIKKELVYVPFYSTESGTLDLSGEIKDMTNPEDIKKKIKEITGSLSTKKDKNDE